MMICWCRSILMPPIQTMRRSLRPSTMTKPWPQCLRLISALREVKEWFITTRYREGGNAGFGDLSIPYQLDSIPDVDHLEVTVWRKPDASALTHIEQHALSRQLLPVQEPGGVISIHFAEMPQLETNDVFVIQWRLVKTFLGEIVSVYPAEFFAFTIQAAATAVYGDQNVTTVVTNPDPNGSIGGGIGPGINCVPDPGCYDCDPPDPMSMNP